MTQQIQLKGLCRTGTGWLAQTLRRAGVDVVTEDKHEAVDHGPKPLITYKTPLSWLPSLHAFLCDNGYEVAPFPDWVRRQAWIEWWNDRHRQWLDARPDAWTVCYNELAANRARFAILGRALRLPLASYHAPRATVAPEGHTTEQLFDPGVYLRADYVLRYGGLAPLREVLDRIDTDVHRELIRRHAA